MWISLCQHNLPQMVALRGFCFSNLWFSLCLRTGPSNFWKGHSDLPYDLTSLKNLRRVPFSVYSAFSFIKASGFSAFCVWKQNLELLLFSSSSSSYSSSSYPSFSSLSSSSWNFENNKSIMRSLCHNGKFLILHRHKWNMFYRYNACIV